MALANGLAWAALVLAIPTMLPAQSVSFTEYLIPTAGASPGAITVGPDGALWFVEGGSNRIGRITVGGAISEYVVPTAASGPSDITTGPDGALWFTEAGAGKIGRITTAGVFTEFSIAVNASPYRIAAGTDGALWFTELNGAKIGRISTAGAITEYALPQASFPYGIAKGPDGATWFTEQGGNKIGRITAAGGITEYALPTPNSGPESLATGPDGAVWFVEFENQSIGRITTAGSITEYPIAKSGSFQFITTGPDGALWFGEGDSRDGGLGRMTTAGLLTEYQAPTSNSFPEGIALGPDGALWFTENQGNKIGRATVAPQTPGDVTITSNPAGLTFTVDGTDYTDSPVFNWASGQSHSVGVASPQVTDPGKRDVFASWSDGGAQTHSITATALPITYTVNFTTQYHLNSSVLPPGGGSISINPSPQDGFFDSGSTAQFTAIPSPGYQFLNWSGDPSGGSVSLSTANPWLLTVTAPSTFQANFTRPGPTVSLTEYPLPPTIYFIGPGAITAGPDGALWFTESGGKIGRITTAGAITEFPADNSGGITAGPDGALWFTAGQSIGRITTAGTVTKYSLPSGSSSENPLSFPCITAGPDGALWFGEFLPAPGSVVASGRGKSQIGRISTNGVITEYPVPTSASAINGIALGPDGALWFTENVGAIGRITTAGVVTEYPLPNPCAGTNGVCLQPTGITLGPDGAMWFTDGGANQIERISTAGLVNTYPLPVPGSSPQGITTGPDGALWFTELRGNKIARISTAGAVTEYVLPIAYSEPTAIGALGPDGALWFAESSTNRIGRAAIPISTACTYSLPQASQTFASGASTGTAVLRAQGICTWTASSGVSWVTVPPGSGGVGNGTVSYTVAANPSTAERSGALTIAGQEYTVRQSGSASPVTCASSVPSAPQVALEGRTEVLGDFLLNCSGLSGAVKVDITLTLNANVTNALTNGTTDAVLSVNGGGTQDGLVAGYNSIRWPSVTIMPAGSGMASVRISKVRADASLSLTQGIVSNPGNLAPGVLAPGQSGTITGTSVPTQQTADSVSFQPTDITGQVSISAPVAVVVTGGLQIMANVAPSLVFTEKQPNPPTGGAQTTIPLVFQESQESSFTAGTTRLRVAISNVPATVQVYAPVYPMEGPSRAQLYSADANGSGGSPVAGTFAGGTYQPLIANGGMVTATWVVLAADPAVIDTYTFPLLVLNAAAVDLNQMHVSGGLAPASDVSLPSATAPVPRYRDFSAPQTLANLRVGTSAAVLGVTGSVKGNAKAPEPLTSGVESNLTFITQVVNDASDPTLKATNVVVRANLPSDLTLISCTVAASVNCSGTGVNIGTLAPGQGTTVTVVAAADPSYSGGVENAVSVSSDQANLDLLASTSRIGLVVGGVPVSVAASPASGSGSAQSFEFQFSDPAGYLNLAVVNVLINSMLDGRKACYLAYEVKANQLDLVDDAGDAGGPYSSVVLGSSSTIQNSQCVVGLTSAVGTGPTLTLTLSITFKAGFGGNKVAFVAARDQGTGNSDWQALGVWQVPGTPPGSIAVTGVTPARDAGPSGTGQQFTFTLTDSKGTGDFGVVDVLINQFIDGRQACYLAYVAATETLVLVDDGGDAGGPYPGSMVLNGGSGSIGNSQCSVSGTGSAVGLTPNTMTMTLNITFAGGFSGNRVFYVAGRDNADGNNTGWQAMGTWTVQ